MSRWGDEKTLFFIACYKDHECLWNPTSFFYKSKEARANAYASLLEQFNDDTLTVQLLKTKIKNIRTTYHQELKKIRYSRLSGAQEYKPTLSWFDALDAFLSATVHKEPVDKITPQTSRNFNNFRRKLTPMSNFDVNTSAQTEGKTAQTPSYDLEPSAKKRIKLVTNKLMKRQDDDSDSQKSNTPSRLDSTPAIVNPSNPFEDEFHFFGMNVAAQLRRLPLQTALQLQIEFQNTLYLARVHGQTSLPAEEIEDPIPTLEEISDSESIENDVDDKEFHVDMQSAVELPIEGQELRDSKETLQVLKKAWDES